jgi:uncharacterized protein YkwD
MAKHGRVPGSWCLPVLFTLLAGCDARSDPLVPEEELPAEVQDFVSLMNAHRVSVGCGPLSWNAAVAGVAQAHSEDMIARSYFAHDNPDGASPFDRLRAAGISYSGAAENIAYGYPNAAAVLDGWLNSSGHRRNIENCGLSEHGVGLEGTHWTHMFIRP